MPFHQGLSSRIHYEQTGTGPDIVWVGGGGTMGRDWQRFQTPHFDRAFRSTVFDNRGIGQTACSAPLPWTIEDFANDLAELTRSVCRGDRSKVNLPCAEVKPKVLAPPGSICRSSQSR